MTTERDTLQRVQSGLFHFHRGAGSFVERQMIVTHGENWLQFSSRAFGTANDCSLDVYGILKTMIDQWHKAFECVFKFNDRHKARSFISQVFDARNTCAHFSKPIEDDEALRYLDSMHQLPSLMNAPHVEIAELKRLYDIQRRKGLGRQRNAVEDQLLKYADQHPDLDDDELSQRLAIKPRQTINQVARRLEAKGLLRRFRGSKGKVVNRASESRLSTTNS